MSPSIDREPSRHQPKPPRLRSACNQCNAAKVKCSGEHEGCARCRTLNTQCIYTESRVGKVQGSRSRRKKSDAQHQKGASPGRDSIDVIVADPTRQSPRAPPPTTTTTQPPPQQQQQQQPWSDHMVPSDTWAFDVPMLDSSLSDFDRMLEDEPLNSSRGTPRDPANGPQGPGYTAVASAGLFDASDSPGGLHQVHHSHETASTVSTDSAPNLWRGFPSPISNSVTTASSSGYEEQQPDAVGAPDQPKLDSRCVLACTHILATLENYLLSELKALDLILTAVRKAAADVKAIVQMQQQSRCERCIILFTAIMFQIVTLLEAGTAPPPESEVVGMPGGLLPGMQTSFVPGFGFGAFSLSPEEQKSWRSRILRRECKEVREILDSVTVLARIGPKGASSSPEMVEARIKCLLGLNKKLDELSAREEA